MVDPDLDDRLTGLHSRKAFTDRLMAMMAEAAGTDSPVSIAFLDVNDFKHVNDQYGHEAGDLVLVAIADQIQAVVGERGTCARFGGDEFALLLPGIEREQAFLLVERIRAEVEQHPVQIREPQPQEIWATVSGGSHRTRWMGARCAS